MSVSSPILEATILVVEDDLSQLELLVYNLEKDGYRVVTCSDGEESLTVVREVLPDLIILDWMLPSLSGIEVARRLRVSSDTSIIPIIMLTARGEESDRVRGLDVGADDYISKPYSVAELLARVRACLRVSRRAMALDELKYDDIILTSSDRRVMRGSRRIRLDPISYKLLAIFMEQPTRVFGRSQLLDSVWGQDAYVDERTVDVYVTRLRKALNSSKDSKEYVCTVRGVGYSFDE